MKKLSVAVAICCALATSNASAEVRINGFASIVGGKSLDSDQTLYGYDDDISCGIFYARIIDHRDVIDNSNTSNIYKFLLYKCHLYNFFYECRGR